VEENEGRHVLQGICCVLKEQQKYQEFPFKSISAHDRFALSLILLGLVYTDLIRCSLQERCVFHPNLQFTTLSSGGIFNFLISLAISML